MPDFLLVGAATSGAETLLQWLGQHPQILPSRVRQTNYFVAKDLGSEGVHDSALTARPSSASRRDPGVLDVGRVVSRREYERCFQTRFKPEAIRCGEVSPAYLYYPEAARRISEQLPHCKIVAVLRDPLERALAHYSAFELLGREHMSLEEALELEEERLAQNWSYQWAYRGLSCYKNSLKRYLARFPSSQIHLLDYKALHKPASQPAAWRSLLAFLEVDNEASPAGLSEFNDHLQPDAVHSSIPDRVRSRLADSLSDETAFYNELFAEAPFSKGALRRAAGSRTVPSVHGAVRSSDQPGEDSSTAGAPFQHLLFTCDLTRESLYYRKISHHPGAHPRVSNRGAMNLLKDEVISFDGFYNAFFESLVSEHTGIESIQLRLELSGKFFVEVLRFAMGRAPQLIASSQGERERRLDEGPLVLQLDLSNDSPLGSRLAFHVTCLSKEGVLHGGSWWTTQAPRRPVQLEILACTFKKREFIQKTVSRVAEYRRLDREKYFITVIDNGSDLPKDLFSYPNVQIVPQGNFGGAGGAARGIIEGLAAEDRVPPTHFLLMDDDIELEPDMVLRAMSWLRHLKVDECIGGGMLDLYRPTHLYELGCRMRRPTLFGVQACIADHELSVPGSLDALARPPQPDFNAWWFMAISRAAVEKNGLPLPCFIRGDDKEFGFRMRQRGIPTLPVPGIGVWHMPFYAKVSAWLYYYNMYNDLLICSLRFPDVTGEMLVEAVWREIEHYLIKLEYDQAAMRILGLEDFLKGPRWLLDGDCEARLARINKISKQYAAEHRKDVEPVRFNAPFRPRRKWELNWRRLFHNGHTAMKWRKPVHSTTGVPRKMLRISDWDWTDVTYFDEVGVKHPLAPGIFVFRKQPEVYFDLLHRAKAGMAILRREWEERSAEFREYEDELTSPKFWRTHLGMEPEEEAAAPEPASAATPVMAVAA